MTTARHDDVMRGGAISMPEVIRGLLARPAQSHESSVTLTRNARGVVQFEVTVRADDPGLALSQAVDEFETLMQAYPYSTTNGE